MGFVIQMVPRQAEVALVPGVLEPADNAARGHLGAETAVGDPRDTAQCRKPGGCGSLIDDYHERLVATARERFLESGDISQPEVRHTVVESWRRSKSFGVDVDRLDPPLHPDIDLDSNAVARRAPPRRPGRTLPADARAARWHLAHRGEPCRRPRPPASHRAGPGRPVAGQDDNTVVLAHYLINGVSPPRATARDLADARVDPG
jgi:hypothetical protein